MQIHRSQKLNEECPIGLICEHFDCRPKVCWDSAAPIDLPYEIRLSYDDYPNGVFVCQLPELEKYPNREESDWVLYHRGERNFRIARIRAEMEAEGWGGFCELPYFYDGEQRALVVTADLENPYKGFLQAVPLDFYLRPQPDEIERDLKPDGFCHQLIWDEYDEYAM